MFVGVFRVASAVIPQDPHVKLTDVCSDVSLR